MGIFCTCRINNEMFFLEMMNLNLGIMLGMMQTQAARSMKLVKRSRIHGVYMIYMAMSMNGCRISGTLIIMALPPMEVPGKVEALLTGLFGAAPGTSSPSFAGRPERLNNDPSLRFTSSVSVSSGFCNHLPLYHLLPVRYHGKCKRRSHEAARAIAAQPNVRSRVLLIGGALGNNSLV